MDETRRQITKIAREVGRLTVRMMKETGVGSGELDLLHAVRHAPGISQSEVCRQLNMDKGAAARRVARLESKGYLTRRKNPEDARGQMLYATEAAEELKNSKTQIETVFYEWLLEGLTPQERAEFAMLLHKLYARSKQERREDFIHVAARLQKEEEEP